MRAFYGQRTPTEAAEAANVVVFVIRTDAALIFGFVACCDGEIAAALVLIVPGPAPD